MRKLLLAIAAITVMASCAKNELKDDGENRAIGFYSVVDNNSKATTGPLTLPLLKSSTDGFGVATSGLGTGSEMSNLQVTYNSGTTKWEYTGDYFWPINPSQNVTFAAYAPYGTSGVSFSGTTLNVSNFTPPATPASQIDLLYAAPTQFNRGNSGGSGVVLPFTHILTQVVFAVYTDIAATDSPVINSIVLTVPKPTGAYNGTAWNVSGATPSTYSLFNNTPLVTNGNVTSAPLLMIPRALIGQGVTAQVNFTVKGNSSSATIDLGTLSTVTSWAPGTQVTYTINFRNVDLKIKFADPAITDWNPANDGFIF